MRVGPLRGSFRLPGCPQCGARVVAHLFRDPRTDQSDGEQGGRGKTDDVSFSYGVGGGFMFRVYQKNKNQGRARSNEDEDKVSSVYINLGLRYRKGGEAEYLTKGSITIDDGIVNYDVRESKTDIVMLQIGVVIAF